MSKKFFITSCVVFITLIIVSVLLFAFSSLGNIILFKRVSSQTLKPTAIEVGGYKENIFTGLTMKDLVFNDLDIFPKPNSFKIQSWHMKLNGFSLNELMLSIFNARIRLPHSSPIVLSGKLNNGDLDFNLYTKSLSDFSVYAFVDFPEIQSIRTDLIDVDVAINGKIQAPQINGTFFIEDLYYRQFVVENIQSEINFVIKDFLKKKKISGSLLLLGGSFYGPRTARILLDEAAIRLSDDFRDPSLRIKGRAVVERVKMDIRVSGTLKSPDIYITSEPQLPQKQLLLMLATNRSWGGVDSSLTAGTATVDLFKDFIGYFFFPDSQNKFLEQFGITDFDVTFEEGRRGVSLKKKVSDRTTLGYGIEQRFEGEAQTETRHKIGAGYDLTEKLSLEVEREYTQEVPATASDVPPEEKTGIEPDDSVMFKYKTKF